ncbi:aldose 1-epimerase [Uliginosibacterium flavum]|uniref:Aldose 1-epimerase n=1 Tax=Uliginosibacterium flavum TaxID=1396831 RepID=A0ABV2TPE7_9RHOO
MNPGPLITLENAEQRVGLLPELGGSAAFWEVRREDRWCPIWRSYAPNPQRRTVANFPLLPWSNRLIGHGFEVDGKFYPVASNRPDEGLPMHGTAWMHAWSVFDQSASHVEMQLESRHADGAPWHYRARQLYWLEGNSLLMRLEVTHLGAVRMPYGLGFHPYILRNPAGPDVKLRFGAAGYWPGDKGVPADHYAALPADWDFNHLREIGQGNIDHNFHGCDGRMRMERPDIDLRLDWHTTEPTGLDSAILYRPAHGEWFCYEPVTHLTGAHARPGLPGLRLLEQGQSMALEVRQTLSRITS